MIKLSNIVKIYRDKEETIALDNISLSVPSKGLIFLVGESGSGKSTLLNILGGIDNVDFGEVVVFDKMISSMSDTEISKVRANIISFVFQQNNLIEDSNISRNVAFYNEIKGLKTSVPRVNSILREVDLEGFNKRYPNELSSGQKQRVSIARALNNNSKLLLLDEPTSALDEENANNIVKLLKRISKDRLVVCSTHDESLLHYADRVITLKYGKVIKDVTHIKNEAISYVENSLNNNNISKLFLLKESVKNAFRKKTSTLLTFLLLTISIFLLSFTSTLSYDADKKLLESLYENDVSGFELNHITDFQGETFGYEVMVNSFDESTIDFLDSLLDKNSYRYIYRYGFDVTGTLSIKKNIRNDFNEDDNYSKDIITGFMEVDNDFLLANELSMFEGNLPTSDNEIVITRYTYEVFMNYGYINNDIELEITDSEDMLGSTLELNGNNFVIVGVLETGLNNDYISLLETDDVMLRKKFNTEYKNGLHSKIFFNQGYFDRKVIDYHNNSVNTKLFVNKGSSSSISSSVYLHDTQDSVLSKSDNFSGNYIILPEIVYSNDYVLLNGKTYQEELESLTDSLIYDFANDNYQDTLVFSNTTEYYEYIKEAFDNTYHEGYDYSYFYYIARNNIYLSQVVEEYNNYELAFSEDYRLLNISFDVIGFHFNDRETVYISDELLNEINNELSNISGVYITLSKNTEKDLQMIKSINEYYYKEVIKTIDYENANVLNVLRIENHVYESFDSINQYGNLIQMIYYISIVLSLIFSVLLFAFLINSKYKSRVGYLGLISSLGVSKEEIKIMFIIENMVISMVTTIVALIATLIISTRYNVLISEQFDIDLKLSVLTVNSVIVLLIFGMVSVMIITLLVRRKFSSLNPNELIKYTEKL